MFFLGRQASSAIETPVLGKTLGISINISIGFCLSRKVKKIQAYVQKFSRSILSFVE